MIKFLTKEELQIITDALLFASTCDIDADFSDDSYLDRMVDVAEKLKSNPSQRLSIYVGGKFEDEKRAKRIGKNFHIKHEK